MVLCSSRDATDKESQISLGLMLRLIEAISRIMLSVDIIPTGACIERVPSCGPSTIVLSIYRVTIVHKWKNDFRLIYPSKKALVAKAVNRNICKGF